LTDESGGRESAEGDDGILDDELAFVRSDPTD
jgi:hypothetical protein